MNTENQIQHNVHIVVPPSNWGEGRRKDVEILLGNIASHILRLLRNPFDADICVIPGPIDEDPICLYRSSAHDPYTIKLPVRDRLWNQYAYQFAHEFCHVISKHDNLKENPNNWFHEAICELASAFTLRCMGERWRTDPPYPRWADYADKLVEYSHRQQSRLKGKLPDGVSLHSWLLDNEDVLREDQYQREKNAVVAYQLLPIFEDTPTGWNVVRNFPTSKGYLKEYLSEWHSLVDLEDKPFVERLSNAFDYTINVGGSKDAYDTRNC